MRIHELFIEQFYMQAPGLNFVKIIIVKSLVTKNGGHNEQSIETQTKLHQNYDDRIVIKEVMVGCSIIVPSVCRFCF